MGLPVEPLLVESAPRKRDPQAATADCYQPWYEKERPWNGRGYVRLKRVLDFILACASLPVIVPVLLVCWVAIRLDDGGPASFIQSRTGKGGRRFKFYKLRTMVVDAEDRKSGLQGLSQLRYPDFKIADDPRVTRVGRILRRTSLDELPQVFNIILGDMSFVGPRPTSFRPEAYSLWHTARLKVRPGLTGLWQVSGRSALQFDERLRLDIAYVRNRCLLLDFQIMLRTFKAVFEGEGSRSDKSGNTVAAGSTASLATAVSRYRRTHEH